ncbi:MAG TPA: hypothetical protein VHR45_07310 [Thermoanaerobaculia bacterium]|nr:hypothetical protein [Thermoanaerobaculia bacterium]
MTLRNLRLLPLVFVAMACLVALPPRLAAGRGRTAEREAGAPPASDPTAAAIAADLDRPDLPAGLDRPEAAAEDFRRRRAPVGETAVPVERYLAALARMGAMPRHSTRDGRSVPAPAGEMRRGAARLAAAGALGAWTSLGPGNVGGRTRALLIDPVRPRIMYAAGVSGGVFKSTDRGASWTALTDLLPNLAVSSLAMDPADHRVIFAGTGEGFGNGDAARGLGIWKTGDGGASWRQLSGTASSDFYYVNKLAVSPGDSNRIFAATGSGVWRSADGGVTWQQVLQPDLVGGCLDLVLRGDQQPDDVVFASCGNGGLSGLPGPGATVYRSLRAQLDGPAGAWQPVLHEDGMGRTSLAIAPSAQNVVYALSASSSDGPGGVYRQSLYAVFRSLAGGDPGSWRARVRNTDPDQLAILLLSNPYHAVAQQCGFATVPGVFGRGWYANTIAVDPADPRQVWVGGVDLFRSDDGGRHWGLASYWWVHGTADSARVDDRYVPAYAHADQHVIAFHPRYNGTTNRILYVGNDGGIFAALDARAPVGRGPGAACSPAATAMTWIALDHGYGVTQIYHGVPFPGGTAYLAASQDNGLLLGRDAAGPDGWQALQGEDRTRAIVDPDDTSILYSESFSGHIAKSVDGGVTFLDASAKLRADAAGFFLDHAPVVLDPNDSRRLWIGGAEMWRSDDQAASWTQASSNLTLKDGTFVAASALAVAPGSSDLVLAGMSNGAVLATSAGRSTGAATVWSRSMPQAGFVSAVAFDPENLQVAYATYSNFGLPHVWKSADGGRSWTAIDGSGPTGLPDVPVHTIVVDPRHGERLYVGTDMGVFVSTDGGANWAVENTGFANVITTTLALATGAGGEVDLFAFTYGRGVFKVRLPAD